MFLAALFTTARTWKQPACPSADEWIKKTCVCIQWNTTNEILPFAATWMQLEIVVPSEVSQKEKGKYHLM